MATELVPCKQWQAGDGQWRPVVMVASGRWWQAGYGQWRSVAVAGGRRRGASVVVAGGRRLARYGHVA
ncbi:unnamed protein product [Prunus armeniaca]